MLNQGGQTTNLRVGTPLLRVGPHSHGWDPAPQVRSPLPRVGHFQKIIVFRYKIQKKEKFKQGYAMQ